MITQSNLTLSDARGIAGQNLTGAPFNKSSIMGKIRVEITYDLSGGDTLDGAAITYNPALFQQPGSPNPLTPSIGYFLQVAPVAAPGTYATVLANLGAATDRNRNETVEIEIVSNVQFIVKHTFYNTADVTTYVQGVTPGSKNRILKDTYFNTNILDNSFFDVYRADNRVYAGFVRVETTTPNTWDYLSEHFYQCRFYQLGISGGSPDLTGFAFSIEGAVSGDPFTEFSQFEDNLVKLQVTDPGYNVAELVVMLVRCDGVGDAGYFLTELQASEAQIPTSGGAAQIDGKIYEPSQAPALNAGNYEAFFTVPASQVSPGERYRVIAIWYGDPSGLQPDRFSHSEITDEIQVGGVPPELDLNPTALVRDYNNEFTGNCYRVAPGERITSRVSFNKAEYNAEAILKGFPYTDIDTDLVQVQIEILDDTNTLVHAATWLIASGTSADPNLVIDDDGTDIHSTYTYRVPYANNAGLPDFTGKEFRIRHSFIFQFQNFNNLVDYYFLDNCFEGGTDDCGSEPDSPFIESVSFVNAETGQPLRSFCDAEEIIGIVQLLPFVDPTNFNLLVVIDKDPFGFPATSDNNALEEESYASDQFLAQLDNSILYDVDEDFAADGAARFRLDGSSLDTGIRYKIKAIALPKDPDTLPLAELTVTSGFTGGTTGRWDNDLTATFDGGAMPPGTQWTLTFKDDDTGTTIAWGTFTQGDDVSSAVPIAESNFTTLFQPYIVAGSLVQDGDSIDLLKRTWATAEGYLSQPFALNAINLRLEVTTNVGGSASDVMTIQQRNADYNHFYMGIMDSQYMITHRFGNSLQRIVDFTNQVTKSVNFSPVAIRGMDVDYTRTVNGFPVVMVNAFDTGAGQYWLGEMTFDGVSEWVLNQVSPNAAPGHQGGETIIVDTVPGREINGRPVIFIGLSNGAGKLWTLHWNGAQYEYTDIDAFVPSSEFPHDLEITSNGDVLAAMRHTGGTQPNRVRKFRYLGGAVNDPNNWDTNNTLYTTAPYDYTNSGKLFQDVNFLARRGHIKVVGYDNVIGAASGNIPILWVYGGDSQAVGNDLIQLEWNTTTDVWDKTVIHATVGNNAQVNSSNFERLVGSFGVRLQTTRNGQEINDVDILTTAINPPLTVVNAASGEFEKY